ncbi:MAG: hypothetical protein B7Z08_05675 [Sphingomonadales bacterium 32-68-7]|nr:MAG: hypothetical protein B7Z33_06090 [Sphingomonadales bacterium 12-68-11]OYX09333.1 MAG: hypothetical protein B7Z08_05675 [Sphingomonadales bacterium 32-68-7]
MYPEPTNIWERIEYSDLGIRIAESTWMFPTFESIHVVALVTVFGMIAIVDLRLVGLANRQFPISRLEKDTLPWVWGAFVLAAITGTLLFVSKASSYMANPYFLWKGAAMAGAGLNMLFFHFVTSRTIGQWDTGPLPLKVKLAGGLSLILWIAVLFFGRAIGFTLGIFDG